MLGHNREALTLLWVLITVVLTVTVVPRCSRADDSSEPKVKLSGYLDGYYSYNFNQPSPVGAVPAGALIPNPTNQQRYYDAYANQLTLNLAEATLDVKAGDTEFLADFDFGTFADLNASSSVGSGGPLDTTTRNIGQAVLRYTPSNSKWSFVFGKMYSNLGLETAKPKDNDQYSRSYLFSYAIPFWHLGAGVGYEIEPKILSANVMIYNGWNNLYDNNNSKTVAGEVKFTPSEPFALTYNVVAGPEESGDESKWRVVHELNASEKLSSLWTINGDFVFGSEDSAPVGGTKQLARWYGGLLSARYQASGDFYVSPRAELYIDETGLTLPTVPISGVLQPQRVTSLTATEGYKVTPHFETRLEERVDYSDAQAFQGAQGTSSRQATLLFAALVTI